MKIAKSVKSVCLILVIAAIGISLVSCSASDTSYDSNNNVVKSGTLYTTALAYNERYVDEDEWIYSINPGKYRLELLNTN